MRDAARAAKRRGCDAARAEKVAARDAATPVRRHAASRCTAAMPRRRGGAPRGAIAPGGLPTKRHNEVTVESQSDHNRITVGSQSAHSRVIGFRIFLGRDEGKVRLLLLNVMFFGAAAPKSQKYKETFDPMTRL